MSDVENALAKLLASAANKAAGGVKAKPQPLNGGYRNQAWYRHILKGLTTDEAFAIVVQNLKTKTFAHEAECALTVWEEMFPGIPFQSKEERKVDAVQRENEELKRRLAEYEPAMKAKVADESGEALEVPEWPTGMDKEKFKEFYVEWYTKTQGHAPYPPAIGKAWAKYQRDHEVEAV